ncbi:uncharacterized protein LOC129606090 [Condylostylus longicornis]|uniref:uncharacterized protein LOC129606090 n=1 Tax=Condylostylus longicornis TaxID=2530218 RepID=UPI00244DAD92|nr:uncharacterized protein LOC129606090 [Condylostylus longicornis]
MEELLNKLVDALHGHKKEDLKAVLLKLFQSVTITATHKQKKNYTKLVIATICAIIGVIWYILPYCNHENCFLEMPSDLNKIFRPPENCNFCRNVKNIERISGISPEEFEEKFAYTARPVIITDATRNWTALDVFHFYYFKEVYTNAFRKQKKINCQFFPYKTEFRSLIEALNMPHNRINFEPGTKPWYFGWSNCNSEVSEILRQHYDRPYFLPKLSENAVTDWIFMGGSGFGAHMHVDNVRLPSWQAQLKGSKEWVLAPPPECYFECTSFSTVVKTGEIIVLDTNKWFHMTNVQPGGLSITIGAEYD